MSGYSINEYTLSPNLYQEDTRETCDGCGIKDYLYESDFGNGDLCPECLDLESDCY